MRYSKQAAVSSLTLVVTVAKFSFFH